MNKYGFTLIELLAVLCILALIFLIAQSRMGDTVNNTSKSAFGYSVKSLLKISDTYVQGNYDTLTKPIVGAGKVISAEFLYTNGDLSNVKDLENAVVVLYNNGGTLELYAFAANTDYNVSGYKIDDVIDNVTTPGGVDYEAVLTDGTTFTLVGGNHLTY